MQIVRLNASDVLIQQHRLILLLQDVIANGAALGFLDPLTYEEGLRYWQEVIAALKGPFRVALAAVEGAEIVGSVQLDMSSRPNGSHRAEVVKLMVHSMFRRQGIGRALMQAIEDEARRAGRTTLVLDTRQGDPAERLYASLGYERAGVIPEYARSSDGTLHATVVMYKLLK